MHLIRRMSARVRARSPLAAALTAAVLVPTASAQHLGDVGLFVSNGVITTNEIFDGGDLTPRRVFGAVLGEFGIPGVGDEPGFDNDPGTFQPGSIISFTIASALKVWDGTKFVTTAADPTDGVRMKLSFANLSETTGSGPVDGFGLAVAPNGEWHIHYIFELLPATGEFVTEPGAYLLKLWLHSNQDGLAASKPFWIVFNHELDDEAFDLILESAETSLDCTSDLNGDCIVDGADLAILLGNWGAASGGDVGDLNDDGAVDGADLAIVLGSWGNCE